jgi:putative ABC transport system permease protein
VKFNQTFKMAIKSIVSNRVRSFLTMLGVIIGVASVIAAVGFAQGSTSSITSSISSLGTTLINITINGRGSNRNVTYAELKEFQEENSTIISSISPKISLSGLVKRENQSRTTTIIGTTADYATIESITVQSGRFLLDSDLDNNKKVAVVGTAVVNDIFNGKSPIGKTIKILGQQFKVVGVLTQTDDGADDGDDDRIFIPTHPAEVLNESATISSYVASATTSDTVDQAVSALETYLTKIFSSSSAYRVSDMSSVRSTLSSVSSTMTTILAAIASISLLVGGVGTMNIMLVSVTERTREIGIRKAIGAKKRNILLQFIMESLLMTGTAGFVGVLLGLGVIKFIIGGLTSVPEVYSLSWVLFSFGFSLATGLFFGIYPANKAANLNPIDALSNE